MSTTLEKLLKKNPHIKVIRGGGKKSAKTRISNLVRGQPSKLESVFLQQWEYIGLAGRYRLVREIRFHTDRKWRFDFGIKSIGLAIEIEGGVGTGKFGGTKKSRHNQSEGYQNDCHKYNEAQRLGWTVLRFTGEDVMRGYAIDYTEKFLREFVPRPIA